MVSHNDAMLQLLQNDLEVTKVDLTDILPAATIMVVSVTASTTQGYGCVCVWNPDLGSNT